MERNVRIKNFFAFLKESRPDENTIDFVVEKLALEIQEESSFGDGLDKNKYLESLLETKNGILNDYLKTLKNGSRKEASFAFRKLMDILVQDVRLHGLGTAHKQCII